MRPLMLALAALVLAAPNATAWSVVGFSPYYASAYNSDADTFAWAGCWKTPYGQLPHYLVCSVGADQGSLGWATAGDRQDSRYDCPFAFAALFGVGTGTMQCVYWPDLDFGIFQVHPHQVYVFYGSGDISVSCGEFYPGVMHCGSVVTAAGLRVTATTHTYSNAICPYLQAWFLPLTFCSTFGSSSVYLP